MELVPKIRTDPAKVKNAIDRDYDRRGFGFAVSLGSPSDASNFRPCRCPDVRLLAQRGLLSNESGVRSTIRTVRHPSIADPLK
jgi:hypothetical protein